MAHESGNKGLAVDLRSGRTLVLSLKDLPHVDTENLCIKITLEAKTGRVARLHVVAPRTVKIGLP